MNWRSVTLSLGTHLAVLLLLVMFTKQFRIAGDADELRRGAVVLSIAKSSDQFDYLDEQPPETSSPSSSQPSSPASYERPSIDLSSIRKSPDIDLPGSTPVDPVADANRFVAGADSRHNAQYTLSEDDLKLIEADQKLSRDRKPRGAPASLQVFGTQPLVGRKFVFVIDRSKSMGTEGLNVIARAKSELRSAVASMNENHLFQVVAYHEHAVTIDRRGMLNATDDNKRLLERFMDNLVAYGSTNHLYAMHVALVFEPDVIVLLSDGGLPPLHDGQLAEIEQLARRRGTAIHCIQFGAGRLRSSDTFMNKMSRQNNGSYRQIDVSQWN
jgi:hypothetical protein